MIGSRGQSAAGDDQWDEGEDSEPGRPFYAPFARPLKEDYARYAAAVAAEAGEAGGASSSTAPGSSLSRLRRQILTGSGGITSFTVESEVLNTSRYNIRAGKAKYMEEYIEFYLETLRDFLLGDGGLWTLVRDMVFEVTSVVDFPRHDETPIRAKIPGVKGLVAHTNQAHSVVGLCLRDLEQDMEGEIQFDHPTWLVPMEGTTGELIWLAMQRVSKEWETIWDEFVAKIGSYQARPKLGTVHLGDSAGANDRHVARERLRRPDKFHIRLRCDVHLFHKSLLEMISLLKGLVGKMCKASHSLGTHGSLARMRDEATKHLLERVVLTDEEPSEKQRARTRAALDQMFGRDDDITPSEAAKKATAAQILTGDISNWEKVEVFLTEEMKNMSLDDVKKVIKDDLIPALLPGNCQVWNISRWVNNKKIIRVLLRILLVHGIMPNCYPRAQKQVFKKAGVREPVACAAAITADEEKGIDEAIVELNAAMAKVGNESESADLYKAQAVRTLSTLKWACGTGEAVGGTSSAIPDLVHLSLLASIYDIEVSEMIEQHGKHWEDRQIKAEFEAREEPVPHAMRKYRLIEAAAGQTTLPTMVKTAKLLREAWHTDDWLLFTDARGVTRRASNFVTITALRMNGAVDCKMRSRLTRWPYRAFLTNACVYEISPDLAFDGIEIARFEKACVKGPDCDAAFPASDWEGAEDWEAPGRRKLIGE